MASKTLQEVVSDKLKELGDALEESDKKVAAYEASKKETLTALQNMLPEIQNVDKVAAGMISAFLRLPVEVGAEAPAEFGHTGRFYFGRRVSPKRRASKPKSKRRASPSKKRPALTPRRRMAALLAPTF